MRDEKAIYSFDIFDTSLVRTCGTPSNFFEILSYNVFKGIVSSNTRLSFIFARHDAEIKAAEENTYYTIYDIYNHFSFSHQLLRDIHDLPAIEIGLEKELTLPVHSILTRIKEIRKTSKKIIFISDMYIPTNHLRDILSFHGLIEEEDSIYVSCDCKAQKSNGSIFKLIKTKERIEYTNWHHWGDNEISDIKEPRRLGINCHHIEHQYSLYQKQWSDSNSIYNIVNGNYKGILAGLSRAINISFPFHPRNLLLADVIAPLYCSFVYKILSHAEKKGINQLFFLSRDTFQLYNIAKEYQTLFPNVSIKYLRISRQALYNSDENLLISFFEQEGLASTNLHSAIVDSTSSGKTSNTINNILQKYNFNKINLLLLTIACHKNVPAKTDDNDFIVYWPNGWTDTMVNNSIVEYIFSSNTEQRTISYSTFKGKVFPVFSEENYIQDIKQPNINDLQQLHISFLKAYTRFFIDNKLFLFADRILDEIAFHTLTHFLKYPFRQYTESLIGSNYLNEGQKIPLIKKESIFQLIRTRGKDTIWPRATVFYNIPQWMVYYFIKRRIK